MKTWLISLAALGAIAGSARAGEFEDFLQRVTEHQPRAVSQFIVRRIGCNHWRSGQAAAPDSAEVANWKSPRALRCDRIDRDERKIRRLYARDPSAISALDEAHGAVF